MANLLLKRIKDWAKSITAFRTGDVIPVDGPDGTAKMSKDDLLKETAQNSLAGNVAPAFDNSKPNGADGYAYHAGDVVVNQGRLYRFTDNKASGSWDLLKVQLVDVGQIAFDTADGYNELKYNRNGTAKSDIKFSSGYYIDKINGALVSYNTLSWYTDAIELVSGHVFVISAKSIINTCMVAIYDAQNNFIESYGKGSSPVVWTDEVVFADDLIVAGAHYVRFGTYDKLDSRVFEFESLFDCDTGYEDLVQKIDSVKSEVAIKNAGSITDLKLTLTTGKYINKNNGSLNVDKNSLCSDFLSLSSYDVFVVNATSAYQACIYSVYDSSQNFIKSYGKSSDGWVRYTREFIRVADILGENPSAKYIRFSSFNSPLVVAEFKAFTNDEAYSDLRGISTLNGKKWVSCGDSFTHGGNLGSSGYDNIYEAFKSYPWWIARRNNMNLVNIARSGERITNSGSIHFTPDRFKSIPIDADIVTLAFGLNETTATIGDSTSSDNTTLWGAFNEVITWILTNIPKCKIGIIIQDAWMTQTIANAEKAIGAFWGIPVIDLKFDSSIPLGIGGRPGVNDFAATQRDSVFKDSTDHPNIEAHKYRSYIIENWLKSL